MDEIFRTRFDEVFMEDKEILEAQQRRLSAAPHAARIDINVDTSMSTRRGSRSGPCCGG